MDVDTEINALELLGSDPDVRELASLERLRVMAAVAPRVRSLTEAQRAKKLRRESGAETTVGEVVDAQLARANFELDVLPVDNVRPKHVPCARCGKVLAVKPTGRIPTVCNGRRTTCVRPPTAVCRRCGASFAVSKAGKPQTTCPDVLGGCAKQKACTGGCGRSPPSGAFSEKNLRARNGGPWRCWRCIPTEERAASMREYAARKAPQERSEIVKRWHATRTPEQRSEAARKANEARKRPPAPPG